MNIGIVLSGGGARGISHLGVLQALEEEGIKPSLISGVSSGAITGGLYAGGLNPSEILELLIKTNIFRYLRPAWSKFGFLDIGKMSAVFHQYFPITTFEELAIPLVVSATNIKEGKTEYFEKGDLINAILASSALPVIFAPVKINDVMYVDGGVVNNLPVEPLIGKVDYIIGVHSNPLNRNYNLGSIKNVIERTFQLAVSNNVKERIKYCNLFIEPEALARYSIFEVAKAREIFKVGYDYTKIALGQLEKDLLKK
jgi:NTE family protein